MVTCCQRNTFLDYELDLPSTSTKQQPICITLHKMAVVCPPATKPHY